MKKQRMGFMGYWVALALASPLLAAIDAPSSEQPAPIPEPVIEAAPGGIVPPGLTVENISEDVAPVVEVMKEEGGAPLPEAPPPGPVVERVEMNDPAVSTMDPDRITLTLTDTELVQVVDLFIKISGANIIAIPTNLTGRVTVSLRDVSWKSALTSILEAHNLQLVESQPDSKVFSIVPKAKDAPEPLFLENFHLQFISGDSLKDAAKALLEPNGRVLLAQGNKLSVLGTSQRIKDVKALVESADKRVPQVVVESKFVELDDQAIKDLGLNWQMLESFTAAVTVPKLDYKNIVINRDLSQDATINFDQKFNSVTTAGGTINDLTANRISQSGKNFTEVKDKEITTVPTYEKVETKAVSAILTSDDLAVTLSALKQNTGAEIISNPKIVVASGQTATIHVGQRRPNIILKTDSSQAGTAQTSYEFGDPPWIETGVKVKVIPTVNTESNITIRIIPELDREIGLIEPTPGLTFPILASRKIESEFALESGKTVAIGGLTETSDQEVVKKIPFLGDIPIIGKYLFSHTHTEKRQSEVIIFVSVLLADAETLKYQSGIPSQGRLITSRFVDPTASNLTLRNRGEPQPSEKKAEPKPASVEAP